MASPPSASKMHASPSKGASSSAALTSANRTYDAKLVQREMLRLGTLAGGLPAAALSSIAGTTAAVLTSATAHGMPTASTSASAGAGAAHGHGHGLVNALGHGHGGNAGSGADGGAWTQLHVYVLPLFNHEPLQFPIEDLNVLVRRHIEAVMSAPSRALQTLEVDIAELINAGMVTLGTKLAGVEDDKLPTRIGELWTFFWDNVLPYVEGVFIPLQTHPLLLSLHRTPKPPRPASPTTMPSPDDEPAGASVFSPIDVRTIALRAFRDKIIVPIAPRLEARLLAMRPGGSFSSSTSVPGLNSISEGTSYQHPRLQQMLLVLHSQAQRARATLSLTAPAPSLSPQELAIRRLLDALAANRSPLAGSSLLNGRTAAPLSTARHRRAPSFLSGGAPRDRRGRIGIKPNTGADSDKENAKRLGRYIDDATYPSHMPSNSMDTSSSSHTIGENGVANRRRPRQFFPDERDEEFEWDAAYGRAARAGVLGRSMSTGMEPGSWDGESYGGMTPRGRFSAERERDRNFLESLRSPVPVDVEEHESPSGFAVQNGESNGIANANLIARRDDSLPALPPPEQDAFSSAPQATNGTRRHEHLDWDSAQAEVERMIGMGNTTSDLDLNRGEISATQAYAHSHTPSPVPGAAPGPGPPTPGSRRRRMT